MAKKPQSTSVNQTAIGDGNVQVAGDGSTVNQTIIQKFFNIFRSDAETVDQRNRRIMLGHVENFWVKGILEKSLHGAALLDLGIKEDPDALNYPWAIKKEATKETLPAGTSMLEIFQEIGMGRSLLILGSPGSGKTTMLLELTRQLIERAREDVTEPIPVVFNLSSWTEKLTLVDWLARELNMIYTIPKKIAPTWVKENKMLLLLDGLDEVRQESRDKCVDAINQFRKENGLTSMAVCSRVQDYAELKTQLSFDGAIEIQPLTSAQVNDYFKRFGKQLVGIKQVLEKDTVLREMAETPLFLSIMTLAYRDTQGKDILVSENLDTQRKHLFDIYIERMFKRPERSKSQVFKKQKQDVLFWLSWLAKKMIEYNQAPYLFENMQPSWLQDQLGLYKLIVSVIFGLSTGLIFGLSYGLVFGLSSEWVWAIFGFGLIFGFKVMKDRSDEIAMVPSLSFNWQNTRKNMINGLTTGLIGGLIGGVFLGLILALILGFVFGLSDGVIVGLQGGLTGLIFGLIFGLILGLIAGILLGSIGVDVSVKEKDKTNYPGQKLVFTINNFFLKPLFIYLIVGLVSILTGPLINLNNGRLLLLGLLGGAVIGLLLGSSSLIPHYIFRLMIASNNFLPFSLVSFLGHCVDLIFLRRVGGGYIFVHRLLMEHFAAMYPEEQ